VPLNLKDSVPEQVQEENSRELTSPGSPGKRLLNEVGGDSCVTNLSLTKLSEVSAASVNA